MAEFNKKSRLFTISRRIKIFFLSLLLSFFCSVTYSTENNKTVKSLFRLAKSSEKSINSTKRNYGIFFDEIRNNTIKVSLFFRPKKIIINQSLYYSTPKGLMERSLQKNLKISAKIADLLYSKDLIEIKKESLKEVDKHVFACLESDKYISCYGEKNDFGVITFINNGEVKYMRINKKITTILKRYLEGKVFHSEIEKKQKILESLFGESTG